jgi:hypothetical protein
LMKHCFIKELRGYHGKIYGNDFRLLA